MVLAISSAGICWLLSPGGEMLGHHRSIRTLQIGMACMTLGFGNGPNTPASRQILIRSTPPACR